MYFMHYWGTARARRNCNCVRYTFSMPHGENFLLGCRQRPRICEFADMCYHNICLISLPPFLGFAVSTFPLLITQFPAVLSGEQSLISSRQRALSSEVRQMMCHPARDFARYGKAVFWLLIGVLTWIFNMSIFKRASSKSNVWNNR